MKLYPSSSAWAWGKTVLTEYDSGCLRSILFKALSPHRPDIDPIYAKVGAHHEDLHAASLTASDTSFQREVTCKSEVLPGVELSGRCDFLLEGEVHETKASLSKSSSHVLKGNPKVSHLSQLVSYMLHWGKPLGRIIFAAYKETKDGFSKTGERHFSVTLAQDGRVLVDTNPTPYYAQDLLSHRLQAAQLLTARKVHEARPLNWDAKFGSPCTYCPFNKVCDKYDAGELTDEQAITQASEALCPLPNGS